MPAIGISCVRRSVFTTAQRNYPAMAAFSGSLRWDVRLTAWANDRQRSRRAEWSAGAASASAATSRQFTHLQRQFAAARSRSAFACAA